MPARIWCEFCGDRLERPDRFNGHRQRCCGGEICTRALNAERQARYRSRRKGDPEWRASEVKRVQAWRLRKRSEADRASLPSAHELAFLGVVSQALGHPPAAEVSDYLSHCRERGHEVAVQLGNLEGSARAP